MKGGHGPMDTRRFNYPSIRRVYRVLMKRGLVSQLERSPREGFLLSPRTQGLCQPKRGPNVGLTRSCVCERPRHGTGHNLNA